MAMNINEIDDFSDEILDGTEQFYDVPDPDADMYSDEDQEDEDDSNKSEEDSYTLEPEDDYIVDQFLKLKGINPRSIKFETEDGTEEKDFNELTRDEQLLILSSNEIDDDYGLTDSEIELINTMRKNNWSASDYNSYIANEAIKNYTSYNQQEQLYSVDDFSDDELYLIDLKSRIPDISEEEAMFELDNAKNNESLYSKRIQNLRSEYKQREDSIKEQAELDAKRVAELQMQEFSDSILNTIEKNSTIDLGDSSLEMSDEDKNILANFLLGKDQAGVRYIARALNDPNSLVQMAWYLTNGKKAFSTIQDYYKQLISEVAKRNYNKGYEDARNGKSTLKSIVKRSKNNTPKNRELTIDDID